MKKYGRKFSAREKERIVLEWQDAGGGARKARIVARRNYCSRSSLYRWFMQYDGSPSSLENADPSPHRVWNKYTSAELVIVERLLKECPGIGRLELYGRLRVECGFARSIRTLYRMMRTLNVAPSAALVKYIPEKYETPRMPFVKWQIDVKYVPTSCMKNIVGSCYYSRTGYRMYQYTCIDEATRKRFLYMYDGFGMAETIDFFKRCEVYFGGRPLIIQTDNGGEFGNARPDYTGSASRNIPGSMFTRFLTALGVEHRQIRPATPRHNGKVERSHLTDNLEFYAWQNFTSLSQARALLKDWVFRYNNVRPMSVLGYKTPAAVERELLVQLAAEQNIVTFKDIERAPCGIKHIERSAQIRLHTKNEVWAFAARPITP